MKRYKTEWSNTGSSPNSLQQIQRTLETEIQLSDVHVPSGSATLCDERIYLPSRRSVNALEKVSVCKNEARMGTGNSGKENDGAPPA